MRTLLAALVLAAAMVQAPTVRVRWARGTNFAAYQTFVWIEGTRAVDPQVDQVIVESVENELAIAGIFPDESEPDLYVTYHASAKEEFQVKGGQWRDWKNAEPITTESYLAGTLVIEIADAAENRIVWRATATATVRGEPKRNRGRVAEVIAKMFADFPPQP
jgi:hypothetical protein